MSYATHRRPVRVSPEADPQTIAGRPSPVAQAQVGDAPTDSPARTLQERLAEDYRSVTDLNDGRRWSPRATLALSGGISLVLWAGIGLALGLIR
jgi:hypothetical protein